jgi:hypothetical protein
LLVLGNARNALFAIFFSQDLISNSPLFGPAKRNEGSAQSHTLTSGSRAQQQQEEGQVTSMASSDRRIARAAAAGAGAAADSAGSRQRIEQGEASNIDIEGEALSLCCAVDYLEVVIAHIS